jgi:hypothetical protein
MLNARMETSLGNRVATLRRPSETGNFIAIQAASFHRRICFLLTKIPFEIFPRMRASMLQNVIKSLKREIFMAMVKNINSNFPRNNNPRFHLSFAPFILV